MDRYLSIQVWRHDSGIKNNWCVFDWFIKNQPVVLTLFSTIVIVSIVHWHHHIASFSIQVWWHDSGGKLSVHGWHESFRAGAHAEGAAEQSGAYRRVLARKSNLTPPHICVLMVLCVQLSATEAPYCQSQSLRKLNAFTWCWINKALENLPRPWGHRPLESSLKVSPHHADQQSTLPEVLYTCYL